VDYLFRGVYDGTISNPAAYFRVGGGWLGLVLDPELMINGPTRCGFPSQTVEASSVAQNIGDAYEELDLVESSVV